MPSVNHRFVAAVILSLLLIIVELQVSSFKDVKSSLSVVVYPIRYSVNAPKYLYSFIEGYFLSRANLISSNENLTFENLQLKSRLQQYHALEMENSTLRKLLDFSESKREDMQIASIIKINNDPFSQMVVINKGKKHGAYLDQPIIDGNGLIGSVVKVTNYTSVLMLLTDPANSVPVVNLRNGLRGITVGLGSEGTLELQYVTNTADVKVGDRFVTSGLGGKYPEGYHVGEVVDISNSASESFSKIILKPIANLNSSKLILMLNLNLEEGMLAE